MATGFGLFLEKKGWFAHANGMEFTVNQVRGGFVYCSQAKYPDGVNGGGDTPQFDFNIVNGIVVQTDTNTTNLKVRLDSNKLDLVRAEYESTLALSYALSPDSVASGATLSDMTNASAEDVQNVATINSYRSLLGLPQLS